MPLASQEVKHSTPIRMTNYPLLEPKILSLGHYPIENIEQYLYLDQLLHTLLNQQPSLLSFPHGTPFCYP